MKKIYMIPLFAVLLIGLVSGFSGDEQLIIPCGGDDELIISCIGDSQLNNFQQDLGSGSGASQVEEIPKDIGFIEKNYITLICIIITFIVLVILLLIIKRKKDKR